MKATSVGPKVWLLRVSTSSWSVFPLLVTVGAGSL